MFTPSERAKTRPSQWAVEMMNYDADKRKLFDGDQTVRMRKLSNGDLQIISTDGLILIDTIPAGRLVKKPERKGPLVLWRIFGLLSFATLAIGLWALIVVGAVTVMKAM